MKKKIAALFIALLAAIAFSQPQTGGFGTGGNTGRLGPSFNSLAFFEFAPASGAGMGSACACANVTGAKGEALTFARTGSATCSRQGFATTGIANGDVVACSTDQPRVELSGGVLGLRVEGTRTNETLRSQQIENAVWATTMAGIAAPAITADFAVAPDGTTTADRMQIPACPAVGNASGINQTSATIASPSTSSVYMKANAGNPSISVCMYGITTGTRTCTQFALNTSTWTRAVVPNVTNTGGMNMEIACENRTASYTGATDTGAADILVWGAQSEAGAYATSYIPTVAASVTRNEETANIAVGTWPAGGTYSLASSFERSGNVTSTNIRLAVLQQSASVYVDDYFPTNFANFLFDGAFDQLVSSTALSTSGRVASFYDLVNQGACVNGTCQTQAATWTWPSAPVTLRIGCAAASCGTGARPDGIVTRVQADPSSSRAR